MFTKNDSKNISRKNKCIKNQPAKLQSLCNFSMSFILMKDSLHILKHCMVFIQPMNIVTYCQKVSLSQPEFMEQNYFFKNLTL